MKAPTARDGQNGINSTDTGTLMVEGITSITGMDWHAVYSTGDLEISGSSTLNATSDNDTYGIWASGNLTISASTTATGVNGGSNGAVSVGQGEMGYNPYPSHYRQR